MENQKSISNWAESTFGPVTKNVRVATRANEEMAELLSNLSVEDNHPNAAEEIADIVIILFRLANCLGVDLLEEISRKMSINRDRAWRLDNTGHGYHL